MRNSINNLYKALIITGVTLAFSATTQAAGYIKFDGIDGEAKIAQNNSSQQQTAPKKLNSHTRTQHALLLPAVQSVREAARRSSPNTSTTQILKRSALEKQ